MTQVKICGITNWEDAAIAVEAGADLLGFIFYHSSPRYIEPARARSIIRAVRQRSPVTRCVGVFVNDPLERVFAAIEQSQIDLAQLHGSEPPEMLKALDDDLMAQNPTSGSTPRAYKALRPRDQDEARSLLSAFRYAVNGHSPAFIVDAFDPNRFGGTGVRTDWRVAANLASQVPILLAGGLSVENVADAVGMVRPWGVDVSSGVERAPGLKDHAQVREFVARAKAVSDSGPAQRLLPF
jgi:phosphoribosylanthranilate isomerase